MTTLNIRPATMSDTVALLQDMREEDREEVRVSTLSSLEEALRFAVTYSTHPLTATDEDGLICMFGATTHNLMSGIGHPWMLATDRMDRWAFQLGKRCRQAVEDMHEDFEYLVNFVDARNTKAVRWLGWIGFTIHEPAPQGPYDMPFHKFEKMKGVELCVNPR